MIKELFSEKGGWNIEKETSGIRSRPHHVSGLRYDGKRRNDCQKQYERTEYTEYNKQKHLFRDLSAQGNYEKVQNNIYPGSP